MIGAFYVDEGHLDDCKQNGQNYNGLQNVLKDLKPKDGCFLTFISLFLTVRVTHVYTLQLNLDGQTVHIGVQIKHNQGKAEADSDQHTRGKNVNHQWELGMNIISEETIHNHRSVSATARPSRQDRKHVQ